MKKVLIAGAFSLVLIGAASISHAQTAPAGGTNLASSTSGILNTIRGISLPGLSGSDPVGQKLPTGDAKNIWYSFNAWLKSRIGISISDIIKFAAHIVATVFTYLAGIFLWIEQNV